MDTRIVWFEVIGSKVYGHDTATLWPLNGGLAALGRLLAHHRSLGHTVTESTSDGFPVFRVTY